MEGAFVAHTRTYILTNLTQRVYVDRTIDRVGSRKAVNERRRGTTTRLRIGRHAFKTFNAYIFPKLRSRERPWHHHPFPSIANQWKLTSDYVFSPNPNHSSFSSSNYVGPFGREEIIDDGANTDAIKYYIDTILTFLRYVARTFLSIIRPTFQLTRSRLFSLLLTFIGRQGASIRSSIAFQFVVKLSNVDDKKSLKV